METFLYPQFQDNLSHVHIALFTQVVNSTELRSRIINAATLDGEHGVLERDAVNFSFVNAQLVTSILHLQTAIYQAILAEVHGTLRTKTVHSEVLWALNPTNNITEAIKRYGVSDATTALFVVSISPMEGSDTEAKMKSVVTGDLIPLGDHARLINWSAVRKLYKIGAGGLHHATGDAASENAMIDNIVTSSVAMKSVGS